MYKVSVETILRIALEGFNVHEITNDREEATKELKIRIANVLQIPVHTLYGKQK